MKIKLLKLQEGRSLPLWTTTENKTYEANLTHIRILNSDQLNALQTLRDKYHYSNSSGDEIQSQDRAHSIRNRQADSVSSSFPGASATQLLKSNAYCALNTSDGRRYQRSISHPLLFESLGYHNG